MSFLPTTTTTSQGNIFIQLHIGRSGEPERHLPLNPSSSPSSGCCFVNNYVHSTNTIRRRKYIDDIIFLTAGTSENRYKPPKFSSRHQDSAGLMMTKRRRNRRSKSVYDDDNVGDDDKDILMGEEEKTQDIFISTIETIENLFKYPVPGIYPNLAAGYPFALATSFLLFPPPFSTLLIGFFCVYCYLGRTLVVLDDDHDDDDYDTDGGFGDGDISRPKTDLFAFVAAIISSGLLSPASSSSTTTVNSSQSNSLLILGGLFVLCSIGYNFLLPKSGDDDSDYYDEAILDSTKEFEQSIMNEWDDKVNQKNKENPNDDRR